MGLSDEDYADAIKQRQQVEQMKVALEQYKLAQQQTSAVTTRSVFGSKILTEQDLEHDAMQAPLSALVDMWTVRHGGSWVSEADLQEDDFWRITLIRLVGAHKLEKHNLASQYSAVYRIIE